MGDVLKLYRFCESWFLRPTLPTHWKTVNLPFAVARQVGTGGLWNGETMSLRIQI
jgi:hypothetical protein